MTKTQPPETLDFSPLIAGKRLHVRAVLVLEEIYLKRDVDGWFRGENREIAKPLGISVSRVQQIIRLLEDQSWLVREVVHGTERIIRVNYAKVLQTTRGGAA